VPPTLTSLRRRSSNNTLEVEHILEAASLRIEGLPELLDELSVREVWSETNHLADGTSVIPFARWARVASAYCRDGIDGLRSVLQMPGHESFVLALLEELHSAEAVEAVLDFFSNYIGSPGDGPILALKIASSLNIILCFKPEVEITPAASDRVRAFANALIDLASDQHQRAVGNESSLALLEKLPPFTNPWSNTILTTRKAIRKRLKKTQG